MPRLYACVISPEALRDQDALVFIARQFSYSIEMLDDGIIFDASGLGRLIGSPAKISRKIVAALETQGIPGSVAVAETIETVTLLARSESAMSAVLRPPETFPKLPLKDLPIEQDTLNVFGDLGIRTVEDLLEVPHEDLLGRYGKEFRRVLDIVEQRGSALLSPNVKDKHAAWQYSLDSPIEDFEQLIFLLNHGLEKLFDATAASGFSTEQLDIVFKLRESGERAYEIKTSFPTLDRAFWLKLINLRVSLDPPGSGITGIHVTSHFTKPRVSQRGLYAVSRPEPEDLLLTVNKLRKIVGEENVGIPRVIDQRLPEAFLLDPSELPSGVEDNAELPITPRLAFSYFRPPIRANVLVRDKRLVFITTRHFKGRVLEYSGVWRAGSRWWDEVWKREEWDIEVEGNGLYRLCKANNDWLLTGEYD